MNRTPLEPPTATRVPQQWAVPPQLNIDDAHVIRKAEQAEAGYWAGAPGAYYDPQDGYIYLLYRLRRPRGTDLDRGARVCLARSPDGIEFEDIWSVDKTALDSPSIERCGLRRLSDKRWALYLSYVDPADSRWRVDVVEATRPDSFDVSKRRPCFLAGPLGLEGVKDPGLFQVGGRFYMWLSVASRCSDAEGRAAADLHGTADAYNTGLIESATALGTSDNGTDWTYRGVVFSPPKKSTDSDSESPAWDSYCRRINTVYREDGIWIALYDGSASVEENYEERTGIAISFDLQRFECLTQSAPWRSPPHHSQRALRYCDMLDFGNRRLLYFEISRPDGSHDLCVSVTDGSFVSK